MNELSDDQREIRELAAGFADDVVAPRAPEWDREHRFPTDVLRQLGGLGLMGVCVPAEHGGAGADFVSYVLVLEQLSRGDAGLGTTLAVHTGAGTMPILAHGSLEQVQRLVPPVAQGHELAAFALTEAGLARTPAPSSRAPWTGGSPARSSGSPTARTPTCSSSSPSRTGARARSSCAAAPPGFASPARRRSLGQHSSSTADLAFDETLAEPLGDPGGGLRIALSTLAGGRIGIAAQATGIAQAALDVAVAYAKERRTFGKPIGAHQAIQQKARRHADGGRGGSRAHAPRGAVPRRRAGHTPSRAPRRSCSRPASRVA